MQLVRTAQPKHKINLLSLSTEAGGPDVGHLVCSINSMQFVRTAQFKHKHLLALYSHSPRRTGGPQAPASGALVILYFRYAHAQEIATHTCFFLLFSICLFGDVAFPEYFLYHFRFLYAVRSFLPSSAFQPCDHGLDF